MKFDINNYRGKYVMHCKTKEEAKEFCDYLRHIKVPTLDEDVWRFYKTNTCYNFNNFTYSDVEFYTLDGYTILEWSDFTTEFTKADLKDGMVVEFKNGQKRLVLGDKLIGSNAYTYVSNFKENLVSDIYNLTINKVYKPTAQFLRDIFEDNCLTLIWERKEEPVEMTLAEVCKALGKEIKIVKE